MLSGYLLIQLCNITYVNMKGGGINTHRRPTTINVAVSI
ncbi:hypothetical protein D088_750004 [Salmonella enterica subsp. houtenae serovar 16:z4,z32:-- str. RKS3027]|nr:hypothetical protein D088_750004 [Salmonella enterica subsp. houtenae serovar 16:z4,z32:-- str. RKS3027]